VLIFKTAPKGSDCAHLSGVTGNLKEGGKHNPVSAEEYICLSCWTSFTAAGQLETYAASDAAEVTCPHCGHVQPARNDYRDGANEGSEEPAANEQDAPAAEAATVLESAASAMDDPSETSRPAGLEPISFDELEELEQLLSNDESDLSSGDLEESFEQDDDHSGLGDLDNDLEQLLNNGVLDRITAPTQPNNRTADDSPEDGSEEAPQAIWRVKSDAGLTYSFYCVDSLERWFEALGEQRNAMVTVDGVQWKAFADFQKKLQEHDDAQSAFESTQTQHREFAEPEAPIGTILKTHTGQQQVTRNRHTKAIDRNRPSASGSRQNRNGGTRANKGGRSASRSKSRTRGRAPETKPNWSINVAFMALGLVVGGAVVYFGMYLLGFYELAF
jgi:DNA-directed RNA polymerase subunit RPC12/RpoP